MAGVNSEDVDSFHTWSADGKCLVFSSRRDDGLYTKPYFTHVDPDGNATKLYRNGCHRPLILAFPVILNEVKNLIS